MNHESTDLPHDAMQLNRTQPGAVLVEIRDPKDFTPTQSEPAKVTAPKTRAKSKDAPEWDKLPEWLPLKDAALKAALMSENSFRTWAKAQRIRTRPFGKCKRYHRDDIRGFKP